MQKLPVLGSESFPQSSDVLDQFYPVRNTLKAPADCSGGILAAADWDTSRRPARAQPRRFSCLLASARTVFSFDCSRAEPRTQQPPEPAALLAAWGRAGCGDVCFQQSRLENGFRPCATAAVETQNRRLGAESLEAWARRQAGSGTTVYGKRACGAGVGGAGVAAGA